MAKFREKGSIVEARQWFPQPVNGDDADPYIIVRVTKGYGEDGKPTAVRNYAWKPGYSEMRISPGDWMVWSDVSGATAYDDATFRQLYDPVEEES